MKKLFYIVCLVALLVGCSKDGAMGPQGPVGPKGEQGEQGPIGIPGKDGSVMLHGTGTPASSLGNIGDMYLDKNTTNLYGPKNNSGWGTPLNLKGQRGATGAKGDKGDTGARGATGGTGATGAKGDKGDKGDTGARGATGSTGAKGDKGDTGATGATGAKGDKGDTGSRGATGATGAKGDKGDDGSDGATIHSGVGVPQFELGNHGDFYLDKNNGDFYGPKVHTPLAAGGYDTDWGQPINLRGAANVVSSNWFAAANWGFNMPNLKIAYYEIPQPILNAVNTPRLRAFLEEGGVFMVYMKHEVGVIGGIVTLPYTAFSGNTVITFEWMSPNLSLPNHFAFRIQAPPTGTTSTNSLDDVSQISLRYVLIPAGRVMNGVAHVGGRQVRIDDLNSMSYEQAGAVLGWD